MKEYESVLDDNIIDIAFESWNPQEHHEELLKGKPEIPNNFIPDININNLTTTYENQMDKTPSTTWINHMMNQIHYVTEEPLLPEES